MLTPLGSVLERILCFSSLQYRQTVILSWVSWYGAIPNKVGGKFLKLFSPDMIYDILIAE